MDDATTRRTIRRCTAVIVLVVSLGLAMGLPLLGDVAKTPEYTSQEGMAYLFYVPLSLAGVCLLYLVVSLFANPASPDGHSRDDGGPDESGIAGSGGE